MSGHLLLIAIATIFDVVWIDSYQSVVKFAAENPGLASFVLGDPELYVNLLVCAVITTFAIRSAWKLTVMLGRAALSAEH